MCEARNQYHPNKGHCENARLLSIIKLNAFSSIKWLVKSMIMFSSECLHYIIFLGTTRTCFETENLSLILSIFFKLIFRTYKAYIAFTMVSAIVEGTGFAFSILGKYLRIFNYFMKTLHIFFSSSVIFSQAKI
jgi:hypothetical protein